MGRCTVWELLEAASKFDGSPTVNEDVAKILKKNGHSSGKVAGCTNTIMAMFFSIGAIDTVGGYRNNNKPLTENAKKKGLWHDGKSGILPGDIVVFGRNGKTNHTELAVGCREDISGNYNGGCSRRYRDSHSSKVLGYVRPNYEPMGPMNDLQLTIAACDVILDIYGTGNTRGEQLSVFGKANAAAIQLKVNEVLETPDKTAFAMAVYIIKGHAGKGSYRKKRLGKFYQPAKDRMDAIFALHTHSIEQAAADVISGLYGKMEVRKALLKFNGYDPDMVQKTVNTILERRGG